MEESKMKHAATLSLLIALAFGASSALAAEKTGEKVVVEQTIELKDGGKLMVNKDGTMAHIDAAGNRVKMRDGVAMEAADGAASRLGLRSSKGTSTASRTRVGLRFSTVLFTVLRLLGRGGS